VHTKYVRGPTHTWGLEKSQRGALKREGDTTTPGGYICIGPTDRREKRTCFVLWKRKWKRELKGKKGKLPPKGKGDHRSSRRNQKGVKKDQRRKGCAS